MSTKFSLKKRVQSFGFAFKGIGLLLRTQPNMLLHLLAALMAVGLGFWLEIARTDWLWITTAIGLVFVAEAFNTALEFLVDLVSPEYNQKAGQVKDLAAGAVLLAAFAAAVIGLLIFLPKIIALTFHT